MSVALEACAPQEYGCRYADGAADAEISIVVVVTPAANTAHTVIRDIARRTLTDTPTPQNVVNIVRRLNYMGPEHLTV